MVTVKSCSPPGTAQIKFESRSHLHQESPDSWLLPWRSLWVFVVCVELGPTAVGHSQAEQLMAVYCLFLHPVGTFSITNPALWGTERVGRGSAVRFCWFYFHLKLVIHSSSLTHNPHPHISFLGAAWTIPKQRRSNGQDKTNWKLAPKWVLLLKRGIVGWNSFFIHNWAAELPLSGFSIYPFPLRHNLI